MLAAITSPDHSKSGLLKPPNIGDHGTVTVTDGVFTDSWFKVTYCDDKQSAAGTCGA